MVDKAVIDQFITEAETIVPLLDQVWIYLGDTDQDVKLALIGDFVTHGVDTLNQLNALQRRLHAPRFRTFTAKRFREEAEAREVRENGWQVWKTKNSVRLL